MRSNHLMSFFKDRAESIGILICIATAVIYGLYPGAARGVYQDGGNITFVILVTTFCRFAGLYSFALMRGHRPFSNLSESKTSFYAGALQALSIIGILGGTFFMPGAVVIVIMFTHSLMLLFFLAWKKDMTLNAANISSTIFALAGLAFVLNIGEHGIAYPMTGIALAALAAFATFGRAYIFGQQAKTRHPSMTGAETFTVAFFLLLLLMAWEMPTLPQTFEGYYMTALASASLTIASFGMFYSIYFLGAYKSSMIMKLEPIFTTLFGILLVGDFLSGGQYLGIGLVLISLMSLQLFDKQKK